MNRHTEEQGLVALAVPLDDVASGPPRSPGHVLGGLWKILELGRPAAFFHAAPVEDTLVGRRAEVWMVPAPLAPSPSELERVRERAVLLRSVRHEGMRRVIDAGVDGDIAWIVVEPLPGGQRLSERIAARGGANEIEIAELAAALAAPLDAAHQAGLVHGLLRPSDVTLVGERVVIDGIGLWQVLSPHAVSGMLRGEGRYLAPEVRAGEPATARSDVYSVGVLLAELVVGALGEATLGADLRVRLLRAFPLLGHALDGALATHPLERLPSVRELANDIDECCGTAERITEITAIEERAELEARTRHEDEEGSDTGRFAPLPSPRQSILGQMIAPLIAGGVAPSAVEFRPVAPPPLPGTAREPSLNSEEESGSRTSWPTEDSILAPLPRAASATDLVTSVGAPLDEPFNARQLARGTGPYPRPSSEVMRSRDVTGAITTAFVSSGSGSFAAVDAAPRTAVVAAGSRVVPWRTHVMVVAALSLCAGTASWAATLLAVRSHTSAPMVSAKPVEHMGMATMTPVPASPAPVPAPAAVRPPRATSTPRAPVAAPPARPVAAPPFVAAGSACPADMALVGTSAPYCIDRFESPGEGRAPRVNLTREDAQAACAAQGRRLCTGKEWERACRGVRGASYPYGASYTPELCRVRQDAPPGPAGSLATCRSASGAFDMSGNVAEWVQAGAPRGGSSAGSHDGRCSRPSPMPELGRGTDVGFRCCQGPR